MTDYVVGFMREALSDRVLMVRKGKPAWQAGLLNGVGGKVDHRVAAINVTEAVAAAIAHPKFPQVSTQEFAHTRLETPLEAMIREFREETGIATTPDEWRLIMYMRDSRDFYAEDGGTVYWFAATRRFLPKVPARVLDSGEELTTMRVSEAITRPDVLATVRWAIPMAFLDPSAPTLGADDDVSANGRAATVKPKISVKALVADSVQRHAKRDARPLTDPVSDRIADHLEAALVGKPPLTRRKPIMFGPLAGPGCDGEAPPVGCKLKFVHRDGAPLCECADVCMGYGMSPDNLERALGTNRTNPEASGELRKRPAQDCYAAKFAAHINPQVIKVGDTVVNKAGTETGKVRAIDGPAAWVQSDRYSTKKITLYLADLYHAGGQVKGPRINGERIVDLADVTSSRRGIVFANGQHRAHNGRALVVPAIRLTADEMQEALFGSDPTVRLHKGQITTDAASGPDRVANEPAERPDASWVRHWDLGNGDKTVVALHGGGDILILDDPLAAPDRFVLTPEGADAMADYVEGGGAQEHFGGATRLDPNRKGGSDPLAAFRKGPLTGGEIEAERRASKGLPPMAEQRR